MSQLQIKRQSIRNQIRQQYIKDYIQKCRAQVLAKQPKEVLPYLTPEQLDTLYNELQNTDYRVDSLLSFLTKIRNRNAISYNQPLIFQRIKYVLNYLDDSSDKKEAIEIAKDICQRTLNEAIRCPQFMEKMFKEVIELIGIHDSELQVLWPKVALIRNQIFFRHSFDWFQEYLGTYPFDINAIMDPLTQTFFNFTIQTQPFKLNNNQYLSIADSLSKILHYYCMNLGELELERIVTTLMNIMRMYPFEEAVKIVEIEKILQYFEEYLRDIASKRQFKNDRALNSVLELIGFVMSGNSKYVSSIIKKYPNLIELLAKLLPIDAPFKKIQIPRPVHWTHHNITIILGVMLCLGNIASCQEFFMELIINGTFSLVVELSAFASSLVKEETAIFLWNLIVGREDEEIALLCDNEALYIICNALTAEHSGDALLYSLKSLLQILQTARSLSSNSPFWHFPLPLIQNILIQTNTLLQIEALCISNNPSISKKAAQCIEFLK